MWMHAACVLSGLEKISLLMLSHNQLEVLHLHLLLLLLLHSFDEGIIPLSLSIDLFPSDPILLLAI